jgi:hypothetical protein
MQGSGKFNYQAPPWNIYPWRGFFTSKYLNKPGRFPGLHYNPGRESANTPAMAGGKGMPNTGTE